MRCAVVADIHSNLEAFRSVLAHAVRRGGYDRILCLGDIVGYGPDPGECIALLRGEVHLCVAGNHDLAAARLLDTADFNPYAASAAQWTAGHLADEDADFLRRLPLKQVVEHFTIVHGSPREPVWEYMVSTEEATQNLPFFATRYCLVGHTHVPGIFRCSKNGYCTASLFEADRPLTLGSDRFTINPGAVGQPRDGDARAAYALLDTEAGVITPFRVEYDIARTQEKMLKAGLPAPLISRLSFGE